MFAATPTPCTLITSLAYSSQRQGTFRACWQLAGESSMLSLKLENKRISM
jgi:hypothetical protein